MGRRWCSFRSRVGHLCGLVGLTVLALSRGIANLEFRYSFLRQITTQQPSHPLPSRSQKSTSEVACRMDLQNKTIPLLEKWLNETWPILHSVTTLVEEGENAANKGMNDNDNFTERRAHYINLQFSLSKMYNVNQFHKAKWDCGYGGGGGTISATVLPGGGNNALTLKCDVLSSGHQPLIHVTTRTPKDNVTYHYDVGEFVECDRLSAQEGEQLQSASSKKEKSANEKRIRIGASTYLRKPGVRPLVEPWVEYHRLIGVQHFWIYIHEQWNLTGLPQKPYITYLPHNFCGRDQNDKSQVQDRTCETGYPFFQPAMNQEVLYRGKQYGLEWLLLCDPDEYLHVQEGNRSTGNRSSSNSKDSSPLQDFLDSLYIDIGAIFLMSIPYGRNPKETASAATSNGTGTETPRFLLDYVWRVNDTLSNIHMGRQKFIVRPHDADFVTVHDTDVIRGKEKVWMNPDLQLYLHHYKDASKGVFQSHRHKNGILRDTTLYDQYADRLAQALHVTPSSKNERKALL